LSEDDELMELMIAANIMVGMLSAIPKTPLHARLKSEGRLGLDDEQVFGTNVIPLNMSREELRDGYIGLMHDLYDAEFYFDRLENLFLTRRFDPARVRIEYWRHHPWQKWRSQSLDAVRALGLFLRLMKNVPDQELRRIYRRRMTTMIGRRPDPNLLLICVLKCAPFGQGLGVLRR
jgi:hypothetical protein